jgi:hypothetical protein
MNEKREQPKHEHASSLNEPVRKRVIDHINQENHLMMKRLTTVPSVINNKKLAHDFDKHIHAGHNLRRRQMPLTALPKDLHPTSPLRNRSADNEQLFDVSMYSSQRQQFMQGSNLDTLTAEPSGIKTVTDFRREVISSKKLRQNNNNNNNNSKSNTSTMSPSPSGFGLTGQHVISQHDFSAASSLSPKMSKDRQKINNNNNYNNHNNMSSTQQQNHHRLKQESLFEMNHSPF